MLQITNPHHTRRHAPQRYTLHNATQHLHTHTINQSVSGVYHWSNPFPSDQLSRTTGCAVAVLHTTAYAFGFFFFAVLTRPLISYLPHLFTPHPQPTHCSAFCSLFARHMCTRSGLRVRAGCEICCVSLFSFRLSV